jgi:hypothetical protein
MWRIPVEHNLTTRRTFLKALPAAVAMTAFPALATAAVPATVADMAPVTSPAIAIADLGRRISEIIKTEPRNGGIDRVEIEGNHVFMRLAHPWRSSIDHLIEKHRKAHLAFEGSCNAADELHEDYGGKPAERRWARLERAEHRAFLAVLEAPPANPAESARKGTYLLATLPRRWQPDNDTVSALLRSLLGTRGL